MTSATEKLLRLLDERGIEWKDGDASYEIEWSTPDGRRCSAMYWKPTLTVLISGCTPEQAIAATLGQTERTCNSTTDDSAWCFVCSECGKSFPRNKPYLAHNHGEINYCPNCGAKVVDA